MTLVKQRGSLKALVSKLGRSLVLLVALVVWTMGLAWEIAEKGLRGIVAGMNVPVPFWFFLLALIYLALRQGAILRTALSIEELIQDVQRDLASIEAKLPT